MEGRTGGAAVVRGLETVPGIWKREGNLKQSGQSNGVVGAVLDSAGRG